MPALDPGPFALYAIGDAGGSDIDIDIEIANAKFGIVHGILVQSKAATTAATEITITMKQQAGTNVFKVRVGGGAGQVAPESFYIPMGDTVTVEDIHSIRIQATKPAAGGILVLVTGWCTDRAPVTSQEPLIVVQGTGNNQTVPVEGSTTGTPTPLLVNGAGAGDAVPVIISSGSVSVTGSVTIDDSPPIVVVPG